MKRVSILVVTVGITAALMSCPADSDTGQSSAAQANLTMSSGQCGNVTDLYESAYTYEEGTTITLVAYAEEGCRYLKWTADMYGIAGVAAADTTIAIEGSHKITANYEGRCVEPPEYNMPGVCYRDVGGSSSPAVGIWYVRYRIGSLVDEYYEYSDWTYLGCSYECLEVCEESIRIEIGPEAENCYASGEAACLLEVEAMCCSGLVSQVEVYFNVGWRLIVSSTEGGSVTTFDETESGCYCKYDEEVQLVADPDAGYRFVSWMGDVDTIADVESAETTITMDDNYSITAIFRKPVNWALIGGIIAAAVAVAVGLSVLLLRRRRTSAA